MARELDAKERSVFDALHRQINKASGRNHLRKNAYDAKNKLARVGFSVPPHMVDFQTPVGWAEKAVSVPAARIRPEGFRLDTSGSELDEITDVFGSRYVSRLIRGGIKSSLKHGPAFLFATKGAVDDGESEVVVAAKSALNATCIQDPRTGVVSSALELVGDNEAILYVPGLLLELGRGRNGWEVSAEFKQGHNVVACEPVIWDWDLDRPFGRSRITRPLLGQMERGVRTLLRQEVTAEFFSAPQRALLGAREEHFTDGDGNKIDIWKAITGGIWALPDTYDEDTDELVRAQLQQLQQASMQPHSEMFKSIAMQVSSDTSMPISYLGIQENQPPSEGAIRAMESDMLTLIEHQIELSYESAMLNFARKVLAVKRGVSFSQVEADTRGLSVRFMDPGTPTVSARSDSALKYVQAFPTGDPEVAMELYGLTEAQIQRNLTYMRKQQAGSLVARLTQAQNPPVGGSDSSGNPPAPNDAEPVEGS